MQREKLIEEVRKYPYLYDLSDAKYSNSIKKDEAWKQISITLKQSESECKKTWLNLRESHRRAMKKRKTKSGQAASTTKKWTFEDEMSFLVPHYKERNTISSVDYDDDSDVSSFLGNDDSQDSINIIQSPENSQPETSALSPRPKSSASSVTSKTSKKKVESNSASQTLMKYLLNHNETKKEDEIETFFNSIAATVKKFSEYNQAVIKSKIYNAVSEMELQEIAEKQSYYSYRNPYIPQREDDMPRGYTTLNNISHEIQSTSGASNIDNFNMSNEENGTSNADDLNTSNIL
ncbi:unnamed protein product [Parnassius mnemosyne]|uniref:Transcription factor Adf-1 n=1 Tax=Parnassius mnemosyne TaxID=213953 RepID=A0AAV1LQK1_9NEOP